MTPARISCLQNKGNDPGYTYFIFLFYPDNYLKEVWIRVHDLDVGF
jgi:hypothetical protein